MDDTVLLSSNGSSQTAQQPSRNAFGDEALTGGPTYSPTRPPAGSRDLPRLGAASATRSATGGAGGSLVRNGTEGSAAPAVGKDSGTETGEEGDLTEMASSNGSESGGDTGEATAEQLGQPVGEAHSAEFDLSGIAGFVRGLLSGESAGDGEAGTVLAEVGAESGLNGGAEANAEFLPFLAAAVPALLSAVGPSLAKAVVRRASPVVQRAIKAVPAAPAPGGPRPSGNAALLQQVMRLLAQMAGRESGSEFGEESDAETAEQGQFAAEVAAAMEVIIGTDDRVRITNTTDAPWRHICALRITFPTGAVYRGTGFFIGPRAVATAGHCVYLHSQGGWARSVEVIAAMNGSARPYGTVRSSNLRSVSGWVNRRQAESDYGCIVLPQGAFNGSPGSFGFAALSARQLLATPAVLAGYPGDKPFAELWGMARRIKTVNDKTLVYDIDTVGGQSGAPLYVKRNGRRYVVGIHNYGALSGNSATRITPAVFSILNGWSAL